MTTQPTTAPNLRALANTMRLANVFTDIACTIGGTGTTPVGITVDTYGNPDTTYTVHVQVHAGDVAAVNAIAASIPGDWDHTNTSVTGGLNYAKRGVCHFGGETVTLTVFTGRPKASAL